MNTLLQNMYSTGKVQDKDGNQVDCFPISVPIQTATVLYDFVHTHKPQRTLEVGMAYGASALSICQALHDNGTGQHTAIDPLQDTIWRSIGRLNLERAGLNGLVRFFQDTSDVILPKLFTDGETFDFAFIDGMHLFDYMLVDFYYADKMLETGGYIVIDDLWMPAIQKAVAFILKNRSYELVDVVGRPALPTYLYDVVGRMRRDLLGGSLRVKLLPGNICIMRKQSGDDRHWTHYRKF